MKVFVIGVGLIGGSLVKDLRKLDQENTFNGIDTNEANLESALKLGLIDQKSNLVELSEAELVILTIPAVSYTHLTLPTILLV